MVRQITPQELARHMENGHSVVLVDVRQPNEHEFAALPGSVLIPLNELTSRLDEIPSPSEGLIENSVSRHGRIDVARPGIDAAGQRIHIDSTVAFKNGHCR